MEGSAPLWFRTLFSMLEKSVPDDTQEADIVRMIQDYFHTSRDQAKGIYADAVRVIVYPVVFPQSAEPARSGALPKKN